MYCTLRFKVNYHRVIKELGHLLTRSALIGQSFSKYMRFTPTRIHGVKIQKTTIHNLHFIRRYEDVSQGKKNIIYTPDKYKMI